MKKIDKIYAFIGHDNTGEGIAAFFDNGTFYPMVGADMERVNILKEMAQHIADQTGDSITLTEFTTRTDIEAINPNGK